MRMNNRAKVFLSTAIMALGTACPVGGAFAVDSAFRVRAGQRQLFLDDQGVAGIEHLKRTMHQPKKRGVVLRPDIPSDGWGFRTYTAPMWDSQENIYKIVYAAIKEWKDGSTRVGSALAVSKDGLNWQKPILGLVDVDGSKQNNRIAVPPLRVGAELVNVIYDPDDPDPSRRYKGLQGTIGRVPVVSPDCIHWRALDVEPLPSSDVSFLSFDRDENRFFALLKVSNQYGRAFSISISENFKDWTNPRVIFGGEARDQQIAPKFIRQRLA